MAKTTAVQSEPKTLKSHAKSKKQDGGDFMELLSGAIEKGKTVSPKQNAVKPETTAQKADRTGASKAEMNLREDTVKDVKGTRTEPQEEMSDEAAAVNMAAQAFVQVPVEIQADAVLTEPVQQEISVQAVTAQTYPAMELQTQATEQTGDIKAVNQAIPEQADGQKQPEYAQTQTNTIQAQQSDSGKAVQESRKQEPKNGTQIESKAVTDETGEVIVSAEVTKRPTEEIQTRTAVRADANQAQARFDGMLAKASQELNQTRADTVQGQPVAAQETEAPEEPVQPVDVTEPEVNRTETQAEVQQPEADVPEDAIPEEEVAASPVKTEQEKSGTGKPAEIRSESWKTETVRTHVPEIRVQKQSKPVRRNEETAANAVQPKTQQVSAHETVRTERQQPVQTAKTPDQFEQIRAQVVRNLEDQKMEFNMRLHPQELGKVDVKMILEGGKLAVEIIAANAKSAEILNKQTEALISSLRLNNLEVTTVNVVTAGQNASGQMDGEYNLNNFGGREGQQDAQGSKAGRDGQNAGGETAGQPDDESGEARPRGILNYSI